jgi:TolB protein
MPSFVNKYKILCVGYDRGKPDIYSIDLREGKKEPIVTTRKVDSSPNYSDIMGRIAFASSKGGNMEIYTADIDGDNEQRLTINSPAISTAPNWSPNGHKIAFVSDRTGSPQIYTMDRTGANVSRITFGGSYHDSPSWSPDGAKIAYTAQRGGRNMIAVNSVDGNDEELITIEVSGTQEYPSWSPDGSHIIFTHRQGTRTDIVAIRLKDKKIVNLTNRGNVEQSKWSGF